MVVNCVEELENKIREAAVKKSIRIEEFFSDFDKLRKGFVTKTQFFRVLYRDYGLVLSEEEENALANKFSGPTCNTVDYKYFCCVIKRGIENDQCTTQYKPNQNIRNEYWNSSMDARLREILSKIHRFYKARELEFPDLCSQFSTNGKITQTQFFRSFVKPSGFDEEDMILLLQRYHDPQDHTLLRYIDLHRDLMQFDGEEEKEVVRNDEQIRCEAPKEGNDLQSLLDRLSQAAYVRQFKTIDVFRPFDTLNKGFIHVSHFLSGLDQCFNKVLKLSEEETSRIFREFSRPQDGFIDYKSFCRIIDDAYLEPDLKQHPMKKIFVPPVGYFGRKTVMLSEEEEAEVAKVLEEVKKELKLYKPLCYFFKDFEKHVNSGYVTTNQFRRALSLAEIPISQTSFDLLCRKFAHSHPGCVSYIKFLEQVDAEVISRRQQSEKNKQKSSKKNSTSNKLPQNLDFDGNVLTFTCLMDKIRNHVVVNRIRVKEFFSDFDPLNSGRVTREQFKRALFLVGTGSLKGTLNFNDSQLEMVADHFSTGNYNACCNENDDNNNNNNNNSWCKNINNKNNNNKNNNNNNNCAQQDREELKLSYNKHGDLLEDEQTKEPCHPSKDDVMWKVFVTELEEGYYREDLDKRPTLQLKPALAFLCSKDGTRDLGRMGEEEKKWFDGLMDRMASKILSSNIDMFSIFRNFDKFRHGHVSRLSFRQALGIGGLSLPDELGLCALESAFHDVDGVNYIRFLDEISKKRPMGREEEDWSADQLVPVNNANCGKRTEEGSDVESILFKMKVKLAQQNIRVLDWFRVFDKNRSGKVTRNNFRRGLDQCRFELNEGDVSIIEDYYQVAPNLVAYMPFCEELESVYVDANIGKTPMRPTKPFKVPKTYYSEEQMSVEDKEVLNSFLLIILKRCKELRPNLMEFLKDFDKVNKGSITCDQFKKVIIDLKLVTENCSQKQWDLLFKRFGVMIGKQLDVNYLEFQKWIVQNNGC